MSTWDICVFVICSLWTCNMYVTHMWHEMISGVYICYGCMWYMWINMHELCTCDDVWVDMSTCDMYVLCPCDMWWCMVVYVCVCHVHKSLITFLMTTGDAVFSSLLPVVLGPVLKSLFFFFFKEGIAHGVFSWGHLVRASVLSYRRMFSCGHFSLPLKGHQESHFRH